METHQIKTINHEKGYCFLGEGSNRCHWNYKSIPPQNPQDIVEGAYVQYDKKPGSNGGYQVSKIYKLSKTPISLNTSSQMNYPSRPQQGFFGHRTSFSRENPSFPDLYKIDMFLKNGNIDPKLISGDSQYPNNVKEMADFFSKKKLTSTQLRRFYDEIVGYENLEFSLQKNKLQILIAKVAYSVGRGTIPNEFLDFMENRIYLIQSSLEFEAFRQHFEAFVAWFKYFKPKD